MNARFRLCLWPAVGFFVLASVLPVQAQSVTVSPASLSFGNQVQGIASSTQKVTLKNGQSTAIVVTGITSSLSDYTQTNTCPVSPSTFAAEKTCKGFPRSARPDSFQISVMFSTVPLAG